MKIYGTNTENEKKTNKKNYQKLNNLQGKDMLDSLF